MIRYLRSTILPSRPAQLFIQTGMKWNQDNVPGMAAALAYYTLFSLFPLLLILLSIFGAFVGADTEAFQTIQESVQRFLPPQVHDLVRGTIIALNENSFGAGVVGSGLLLMSASTAFAILRNSVNRIWRSPQEPTPDAGSPTKMVLVFVANKLLSFLLVFGTALILFAALLSSIAIKTILQLVATFQETFAFVQVDELQLTRGLQIGSSFFILTLVACVLFKILPAAKVSWRDVWLGALLTALLLVGLQQLVSNSVITIGSRFLSYGVIGSVMILLLWIFFTCQIFLLGCVFSYTYAYLLGSRRHRSPSSHQAG
ncbi:YihY/virulence factor BrkB family protein [Egbenema bharatensis]|uniref:YihY/virulence factor BrkB family protein n=1 Tax=Egbenema bharatensis TaxID=3463334 RepID=UPI003A88717A